MTPGTEVLIGPEVLYSNWRGRLVRGPRSLAGRRAWVIGLPDREGDVPLRVEGKFYEEQLSPACLTVIGRTEPVVGFAPGAWDLLHQGHGRLLERARLLCDELVVGVASDEQLAATKGRPPVWGLRRRIVAVAELGFRTVVLDSPDWGTLQEAVGYRRIFKGDDWAGTDRTIPTGVDLILLRRTRGISTTQLRANEAA